MSFENSEEQSSDPALSNLIPMDSTPTALLEQLIYVDSFMPDADPTSFDNQLSAELAAFADDSFIFPDEEKPKNNHFDDNNNQGNNNSNNNNSSNNNSHPIHLGDSTPLNVKQEMDDPNSIFINNNFTQGVIPNQTINNNTVPETNEINPDLLSQSLITILSSQGSTNNSIIDSLSTSLLSSVPKVHVPPGALSTLTSAGLSQIQIDALAALIAQHQLRSSNGQNQSQNANENSGFHDSALSALHGLTTNSNVINNFTPNNQLLPNEVSAPISNLVTLLNANTPKVQDSQPLPPPPPPQNLHPDISTIHSASISPSSSSPPFATTPSGSSDAADSDKRRRNTAASARFRIKRKMKEQEMERNIRELNENSQKLQMRIQQLELENRLLRNLVVEKGAQRNNDELERLKQRAREGV